MLPVMAASLCVTGVVEIQKIGGFKMLFNYGHILPH